MFYHALICTPRETTHCCEKHQTIVPQHMRKRWCKSNVDFQNSKNRLVNFKSQNFYFQNQHLQNVWLVKTLHNSSRKIKVSSVKIEHGNGYILCSVIHRIVLTDITLIPHRNTLILMLKRQWSFSLTIFTLS